MEANVRPMGQGRVVYLLCIGRLQQGVDAPRRHINHYQVLKAIIAICQQVATIRRPSGWIDNCVAYEPSPLRLGGRVQIDPYQVAKNV